MNKKLPKCQCACHENKLRKPYEHTEKCCANMNGFILKPAKKKEKTEEDIKEGKLEDLWDFICVHTGFNKEGKEIQGAIRKFIELKCFHVRQLLSARDSYWLKKIEEALPKKKPKRNSKWKGIYIWDGWNACLSEIKKTLLR